MIKIKKYIKLSVDYTAYYSGQTYYEELYLTEDMWNDISNKDDIYIYLHGLDGKHSEAKVEVNFTTEDEENFKYTTNKKNDGKNLIETIHDRYMSDKYSWNEVYELQDKIKALSEVLDLTIKIKKSNENKVLELLKEYLV